MLNKSYKTSSLPPPLPDSNIHSNAPSLRLYQVWKGSNRFYLGGRLIFGPDARSLLVTMSLILTPVLLFCTFISQRLVNELPGHLGILVVAISVVFTAYIIILLLFTSGRDPGIIPRNPHPPEPSDDDVSNLSLDWAGSQAGPPILRPAKDVLVNGTAVKVKYCHTCMLYRPPRCSHCSICNNCVERFDHHCPWVGQCIGKRNYRFFFVFISSTTILCLHVFALCWVNIKEVMNAYHCNLWRALMKSPISGILILYTFIAAWFVGGLTAFHLYLIFSNQTTYENFRYRYDRKSNPYNLGWVGNFRDIFFSKIPASRNNFRAVVEGVGSASVLDNAVPLGQAVSPEMAKRSFDIEMGKRHAVAAEDFEDLQSQIESVGGVERRGRVEPRHGNWDGKNNLEMSPDVQMMATEFGMGNGLVDREKNPGGH